LWAVVAVLSFTRQTVTRDDAVARHHTMLSVLIGTPLTITTQRATACRHDALPAVYFLLTSTPDRARRLPSVLRVMRQQTLRPHAVVLTIARRYDVRRFANATYPRQELRWGNAVLDDDAATSDATKSWLIVHTLEADRGPISKYLGALSRVVPADAVVVVGDDDINYGNTFIEDYACAVAAGPPLTVFSSGIDMDCRKLGGCVMGFRGVAMRAAMLHALPDAAVPRPCFLADDVSLTHFLRARQYAIRRLRLRTKYRFDDAYAWSNSSIHACARRPARARAPAPKCTLPHRDPCQRSAARVRRCEMCGDAPPNECPAVRCVHGRTQIIVSGAFGSIARASLRCSMEKLRQVVRRSCTELRVLLTSDLDTVGQRIWLRIRSSTRSTLCNIHVIVHRL
jgi:hypothetical protein